MASDNNASNSFLLEQMALNYSKAMYKRKSLTESLFELNMITYYMMGICAMAICSGGIIGNTLSLIVLTKRNMRNTTTNMYLIALAISDMLVLVFTIFTAVKDTRPPQPDMATWMIWQDAPFVPRSYPACHAFAVLFQVSSVWLTVAFTLDRYIMICHPFWAQRICSTFLAKSVIFVLFVVSTLYNVPRFFENVSMEIHIPAYPTKFSSSMSHLNDSVLLIWYRYTELGLSAPFRIWYHLWAWCILIVAIPLVSIAIMNIFLIREVHQSAQRGRQINAVDRRRQDTNVMLISVIIIFFICQLPAAVSHILWGLQPGSEDKGFVVYIFNELGNIMIILNSAINIVPYYFFGKKFRQEFLLLFCPRSLISKDKLRRFSVVSMDSNATRLVHHTQNTLKRTSGGGQDGTQGSQTKMELLAKPTVQSEISPASPEAILIVDCG